jgi:hypothetical protein
MKYKKMWIGLIMAASIGMGAHARAGSISYHLNQTNVDSGSLVDGVNYALLTIDDDVPNSLRFTLSLLPPLTAIASSNFGIDNFSFNVLGANPLQDSGAIAGQWTLPLGWGANVAPPNNQADGFGRFDASVDGSGASRVATLTFTVNNTALNLFSFAELSNNTAGQGNVFFSAHVAGFDGPGTTTSGYFGGSTLVPVPLPAGIPLFASALAALGFGVRKRRQK